MAPVVSRIDDDHARLARNIRFLSFAAAANMFAWLAMKPARPEMILRITGGDDKRSAKLLALLTTVASLIEFLVTPLLGRLSDMYGKDLFWWAPRCSAALPASTSSGSLWRSCRL